MKTKRAILFVTYCEFVDLRALSWDMQYNILVRALGHDANLLPRWVLEAGKARRSHMNA